MKYGKEMRYPVDGESSANGTCVEQTITYEREDIIDGLVELFESDYINDIKRTITLGEDVEISTWIDEEDLHYIHQELEHFLDDDWGTDKIINQLVDWFDNNLSKDTEYQVDTIRYI